MSLYIFDITKDKAIVSADSRMSGMAPNGQHFKINDDAKKLHIINDIVITVGGVYNVCEYVIEQFEKAEQQNIYQLYLIVVGTIKYLDEIAKIRKWPNNIEDMKNNKYLLEVCAVQYNPIHQCNVFYTVSTMTDYKLIPFPVDNINSNWARTFGGVDQEIVKDYLDQHQQEAADNYESALLAAYEAVASEKVGGMLNIATMDKGNVSLSEVPIRDSRPIRKCLMGNVAIWNNMVGNNLIIQSQNDSGGVKQFTFDTKGAFLNNAEMVMQKDGGGQILFDPRYGIAASSGSNNLFTVSGTTVVPSFIDQSTGNIIFDEDGMPINTNFYLDINSGNPYFRGTVFAEDGKFKGTVQATDFLNKSGESILTDTGKFKSSCLDLGNITLDGETGNASIRGNLDLSYASSINFGTNLPIKFQFSVDGLTSWHADMTIFDKYRRDSTDSGISWGTPYQFRGTDGINGSDADVPAWVKAMTSTYIDNKWVIAPHIYGGDITSNTTINVGTDATIGRNLYLKDPNGTASTNKGIWFNGAAFLSPGIWSSNNQYLTATAQYLNLIGDGLNDSKIMMTTPNLDLSYTDKIVLQEGYTYGTLAQRNALSSPSEGQIFFVIS